MENRSREQELRLQNQLLGVTITVSANQYIAEFGLSTKTISERGLVAFEEAQLLEVAEVGEDGREHLLTPVAAKNWRLMKQAAISDGESIFIVSGYRSVSRQAKIIRAQLKAGKSIDEILEGFAPPGFSEHHSGRAVDLSTPDVLERDINFETTTAFQWLRRNAERFGYRLSYPRGNTRGYIYESWHWYCGAA
jgi:D-alanyl-D-alanine carboxypeptidase